ILCIHGRDKRRTNTKIYRYAGKRRFGANNEIVRIERNPGRKPGEFHLYKSLPGVTGGKALFTAKNLIFLNNFLEGKQAIKQSQGLQEALV
ncbi:hypothetical protein, partial [Candidatus Avelusimicrobium aviculae]|uniref:hypothetical protein n=1 Tax=Candidatus Avelusimicrobium aviculae TaxID=3416206 RepID=UPI003D096F4B